MRTPSPKGTNGRESASKYRQNVDLGGAVGGHWTDHDGSAVYIEEMAGVYRADFDPQEALTKANRTVEGCRNTPFTVTDIDVLALAQDALQRIEMLANTTA